MASDRCRCAGRNLGPSHQQRQIKRHVATRFSPLPLSDGISFPEKKLPPRGHGLARARGLEAPPNASRLSRPPPSVGALAAGRRRPGRSVSLLPPPATLAVVHRAACTSGCRSPWRRPQLRWRRSPVVTRRRRARRKKY